VRNILIDTDGKSWIIDFDDAVISETISDNARYRNLLRLRRSFQKNFLDLNDFDSLCEGYGLDTLPQALELVYSIKRKISDALGHSTGEADNK
jgi:RIO-like serine/threonine protein kinase